MKKKWERYSHKTQICGCVNHITHIMLWTTINNNNWLIGFNFSIFVKIIIFSLLIYVRVMVRGIFIACHNEAREKLIHIVKCAFSWNCVCREPLIHQGCSRSNEEMHHRRGEKYIGGDSLIRGLQERQNDAIIDFRFGGADCSTYNKDPMIILLNR